jgi:copper chaperone
MPHLTLQIDGMSCGHCVAAVKSALAKMDGVAVEQVDIGSARVTYDPARVTPEQSVDAVNDEGYVASRE